MEIGTWRATWGLNDLYRRIRDLDLEDSVAELDAFGFTVIPPEKVGAGDLPERLRSRILEVAEERSGVRPDVETGSTHEGSAATGQHLFYLLYEGREFEEALMNPVVESLITYLLGDSALLSSSTSIIKGPGQVPLNLHSDLAMVPAPFPAYAQVANATWVLSEYTEENGALCFVPGSHRFCRNPAPGEGLDLRVPVEAPIGSLVVWHGNTWHGAFPRTTPGLRMNLILYFCRLYMQTQERYRETAPDDLIERNVARMAKWLGRHAAYGWQSEGPDPAKLAGAFLTGVAQHL